MRNKITRLALTAVTVLQLCTFPINAIAAEQPVEYSNADENLVIFTELQNGTEENKLYEEAVPVEKAELKLGADGNIISDYEGNEAGFPVSGVTDDMKIEYSIADESIAKIVYSDNTNVTVACLKEGTTTLTAKTSDGQTAEMEIVVLPVEKEAVPVDDDLPQTGYSNIYKVIAGLAALMTVSGAALVVKTRKENE